MGWDATACTRHDGTIGVVTGPSSLARPARLLPVLLGVLMLLVAPPAARADLFVDVYRDFQKDGAIDACAFTAAQLKKVRDEVPPDIEQYAPDFPAALALAIEQRGSGDCKKAAGGTKEPEQQAVAPSTGGTGGTPATPSAPTQTPSGADTPVQSPVTPATTTPQPAPAPAPAPAAADGAITKAAEIEPTSGRSDGLPAAVVGLGALAGLLAVLALAWLLARALAWEPGWWPRARHAVQEAGWRASGTWADFTDWVRLGR